MDPEDIMDKRINALAASFFAILLLWLFVVIHHAMEKDMEYLCSTGVVYDDKCS